METKNPNVDLHNASHARGKGMTKEEYRKLRWEVLKEDGWTFLGYSIGVVALLSIGYNFGNLLSQ